MNRKKLKRDLNSYKATEIAEEYQHLTFTVILVKPEHSGNIGSIARIMRNFDFENLVLFNPIESRENIFSYETQGFAMHGKDILMNARFIEIKNQE
ncbi:MAG: hypothetical protein ACFFBE_05175, partial [Promethearchaeota archaeon]